MLLSSCTQTRLLEIESKDNIIFCWAFSNVAAIEYIILKKSSAYTSQQLSAIARQKQSIQLDMLIIMTTLHIT